MRSASAIMLLGITVALLLSLPLWFAIPVFALPCFLVIVADGRRR